MHDFRSSLVIAPYAKFANGSTTRCTGNHSAGWRILVVNLLRKAWGCGVNTSPISSWAVLRLVWTGLSFMPTATEPFFEPAPGRHRVIGVSAEHMF